MKYGIIYKITNKVNGKVYIGKTVQTFKQRVKAHKYKSCRAFNNAIKSYGWDSFEKEEFISALDEKYLASLEEQAIKFHNCLAPNGYNLVEIDQGLNRYSEETKNKISESRYKYLATLTEPVIPKNRKPRIIIDNIEHKDCSKCKKLVPMEGFAIAKKRWDGRFTICKECIRKYNSTVKRKTLSPKEFQKTYKTRSENVKAGLRKIYEDQPERREIISKQRSKPIIGTHIETGKTIEFPSALKAKKSGFSNSNLGVAIKNQTPYKKYMWKFK